MGPLRYLLIWRVTYMQKNVWRRRRRRIPIIRRRISMTCFTGMDKYSTQIHNRIRQRTQYLKFPEKALKINNLSCDYKFDYLCTFPLYPLEWQTRLLTILSYWTDLLICSFMTDFAIPEYPDCYNHHPITKPHANNFATNIQIKISVWSCYQ